LGVRVLEDKAGMVEQSVNRLLLCIESVHPDSTDQLASVKVGNEAYGGAAERRLAAPACPCQEDPLALGNGEIQLTKCPGINVGITV
jgi:hypothetical protein